MDTLDSVIKEFEKTNKQLAKLTKRKEELTEVIINYFGHNHDGQKSYDYDIWKVECKTPLTYSLDKKLYESGDVFIDDGYNPVKSSVSYSIDKKLCDKYMTTAPEHVRESLGQLITVKSGKPSVNIKERV